MAKLDMSCGSAVMMCTSELLLWLLRMNCISVVCCSIVMLNTFENPKFYTLLHHPMAFAMLLYSVCSLRLY